jgi:hypothetical protein
VNGAADRYDLDEIRLALLSQVPIVAAACGIEGRGRREIESRSCPRAQHGRGRSCVVDARRGLWHCLVCNTGGDMLDLVAESRGLDIKQQFGAVLAAAAELTGVAPLEADPAEAERRRADASQRAAVVRRQREQLDRADAERQAAAIAEAAAIWPTLPSVSAHGEMYLRSRGIEPGRLRGVRYGDDGISVPLHDRAGAVRNIVTRRYPELVTDEDDRKVLGRAACPTAGTLLGHVAELDEGRDVAIIAEGVIDTLAAAITWPTCVVLGAHGAAQMAGIAEAAAPRIRELRGWLLIAAHNDDAGVRAGIAAVKAAQSAGLELDRDLLLVELGAHNDLADALVGGWAWSWPN